MQLAEMLRVMVACVAITTVGLTPIDDTEGEGNLWKVAVGMDWGAHEYINEEGYLTGFGIEFVDLGFVSVCEAAGMICFTVRDTYENCWTTSPGQLPSGGKGLQGRWYDACMGWAITVERVHIFSFSAPYLKADENGVFYVRRGEASAFDPYDLEDKTIGFLLAWAFSEECIAREKRIKHNQLTHGQIHHSDGPKQILASLHKKEIDALFAGRRTFSNAQRATVEEVPGLTVGCLLGGNAIMTRKTSSFNARWNVGFSKVRADGRYKELCDRWRHEQGHIGKIHCL